MKGDSNSFKAMIPLHENCLFEHLTFILWKPRQFALHIFNGVSIWGQNFSN